MGTMRGALPTALLVLLCCAAAGAQQARLRVLVDKVLMKSSGWVMQEEHVRQIAAAGFTVVSPRQGSEDLEEVRRIARLAGQHGLRHLPWMRGTLPARGEQGPRLVWSDGGEQELYSPNADSLWVWLEEHILGYARISREEPALMGVFLDFENYAPGSQGNGYSLSYDGQVLADFAATQGIEVPALEKGERRRWLVEEHLHEAFAQYQVDGWRRRCRALREKVDRINPAFQFCVYPAPGTPFIRQAVWAEWATPQAPLILADPTTYGRPAELMAHADALASNRERLRRRQARARQGVEHLLYMGGIDPVIRGADPEFSARNAAMIAQETDGYWVFYEGPTYGREDHRQYWEWFARANKAIEEGRFEFHGEARATPDPWALEKLERRTERPQIALYGLKEHMVEAIVGEGSFEVHELRGLSSEYLGQFDAVLLQNFNVEVGTDHPWVRALRRYVEEGGGLMLAHDTGWFMESPVPEVAARAYPAQKVEAVRHVVDRNLQVVGVHPAAGGLGPGTRFVSEFRDHMIFTRGSGGRVLVENFYGEPVYVVGEFGRGRVVFSGAYYGYERVLEGAEKELFFGCLQWLVGE